MNNFFFFIDNLLITFSAISIYIFTFVSNFFMKRVNFYVDGFNLYYGLKDMKKIDSDWLKFYWLDYVKFFQHFVGEDQILQKVVYFAAPPPTSSDPQGVVRQRILFNANKLLNHNKFELVLGQFYNKNITCKVCKSKFFKSIMPDTVSTEGKTFTIPPNWKV